MKSFLLKNNTTQLDLSLLLLRIVGGGLMLWRHGLPKLRKIINGDLGFADPVGLGSGPSLFLTTFAEFFCALLIMVGFKSRLASIPLMIAMLVAAFIHHADDPFNKKEFPLLYFTIFLVIFLSGSGKYGIEKS